MRELIKAGAYSFVPGTRQITITDGRGFTAHDILLIYNETQDEPLVSTGAKMGVTVVDSVITYPDSVIALAMGDILRIDIDFPQHTLQSPTYTSVVHFTSGSAVFNAPKNGVLKSFGNAHNIKIKPSGGTFWIDISLPYSVNIGDAIYADNTPGGDELLTIELISQAGITINPGTLGSKIINGVNRFAYYSPALSKVAICGLAIFDEDYKLLSGDGNIYAEAGTYASRNKWSQNCVEVGNYLYFYSYERSGVCRLNLTSGEVTLIFGVGNANTSRFVSIGNYVYYHYNGNIRAININDLSDVVVFSAVTTSQIPCSTITDGVSMYTATYSANTLFKVEGLTLTQLTLSGAGTSLAHYGDFVYSCLNNNIRKINKSTLTLSSTITTNINTAVMDCICVNGYLYSVFSTGQITKIELATFTSPSLTLASGISCNSAEIQHLDGHLYILLGDTNKFLDYNLSNDTFVENTLANNHTSMNVDLINKRLIFFTVTKSAIPTLYPVEIIQL